MSGTTPFKRIVLEMSHGGPDDATLRVVADFAEILRAPLLGLCAQDPGLLDLAGLPFVREFRPLGGGWRPLDVQQLTREVELAAEQLQRRFARTLKDVPVEARFRVVKGSASNVIAEFSELGDIVAVTEPAHPADRATQQATSLLEAAFRSNAAVLLLPHRIARRTGPIVAVATEADDPAVRAAAAIAAAIGERLVLIETDRAAARQSALSAMAGIDVQRLRPKHLNVTDASAICAALSPVAERLAVMTRGAFDDAIPRLVASMRHVPVLVAEPGAAPQEDG